YTIAAARHISLGDRARVEATAHDLVANVNVLHATCAHDDDRVLLEAMAFARDVGGNFLPIGESHTSYFADGRVRLARRHRRHFGANPAFKRRRVEYRAIFENIKATRERGRL